MRWMLAVLAMLSHTEAYDIRLIHKAGKEVFSQRNQKNEQLKVEREKNRALRMKVVELRGSVECLSSINATMTLKNTELPTLVESKNITVLMPDNGKKTN